MTHVRDLQAPLRARYHNDPPSALVVDRARSAAHDPADFFHASVKAQGAASPQQVAVHAGHGGPHDGATPGDILCAALCCCHELTIRMVAGAMGLDITRLDVEVEGEVDLRGSLGMQDAPVGFRAMRVRTRLALRNGGPLEVRRLLHAAEALCVVGQTLAAGVAIEYSPAE
jgi:uncharacterized OsmC-like protein